jgi:hydroxymethylglutaryl-CoA synthase
MSAEDARSTREPLSIAAAGAYAPSLRIDSEAFADAWGRFEASGIDQKAVPEADEDALTMAWEAARRALEAADVAGTAVDWLGFATTTPPLAESDLTTRLGSALGVPEDATRHVFTGSTRAGTRALFAALDGAGTEADVAADHVGLVVASDCPEGDPADATEHAAGAGAAALVLRPDGGGSIVDRAEHATPYPGTRFRQSGSDRVESIDVTSYERNAFSETLAGAVDGLDVDAGAVDAAAVQAPDGGLPYRAAGALGVDAEQIQACATVQDLGDTGAASVLLSLATALGDDHDRVLGAAFGSGAGADALVVDRDGDVPTALDLEGETDLSYPEYLRRRGDIVGGPPEGGAAYISVPSWQRSIPQRHRLVAGQCPECGAVAFPPSGACRDCRTLVEYDPLELPPTGEVETATTISRGGEPPEFAKQQAQSGEYAVAVVEFTVTDGPEDRTVSVPMQGVAGDLVAGDAVRTVLRRIYTQEGVIRYGRKAERD